MKRVIFVLACGLVLVSLATTASAAIRITKIYFDPPGADTGSNSSLNAEWITVKNTGSKGRQLLGWKIRDNAGHVYRFGDLRLPAGDTVKLHTGSGADSFPHHLYWDMDNYVWNNDGDKAILKTKAGTVVDTCSYSGAGSYVNC